MRPTTLILAAALTGLALAACSPLDEQDLLDEGTSALVTSEETGDISPDAVAEADLPATAVEDADVAADATAPDVCDFDARRAALLAKYDANGDGKLDRTEAQALRADIADRVGGRLGRMVARHRFHALQRVRWAFDLDGDRQLDDAERAALIDALRARCERRRAALLEKFDANADGTLDETERLAARAALKARLEAKRAEILARYDADHDGLLSLSEREALRADRLAARQARRAAILAEYDKNGDGRLNPDEALPLRQKMQDRIRNGSDAE